jgi:OOP family OmpA-OmpF porin
MRLSVLFVRLIVFVVAGLLSYSGARMTVAVIEDRSAIGVREALIDQGDEWASVVTDGLQVILEGQAPSEAVRFRAISAAGSVVDASRVIDSMSVIDSTNIAAPEFQIEILRNDSGVSLIGLIPDEMDRTALAERIASIADDQAVTDLLETARYPMPDSWPNAITYALRALDQLPRSKISVSAQSVSVDAISDSETQKRRLEASLGRNTPEDITVRLNISAPRPVISPFTTRFTLDQTGARFDACAVNSREAEQRILEAAAKAGYQGRGDCTQALGVPSRTWGEAVALAIDAVTDLEGGTVTVSNTDIALVAVEGTPQESFDRVVGELENSLPDVFALTAELPKAPDASDEGPPTFTATLSPEGTVQLRGRVPDDLTNRTAENFAFAKFGRQNITMGTRVVDGLPVGWPVRVLAGIEALSNLSNGSVLVSPDEVSVRGNTGNTMARAEISRLLIDKLGETANFTIDVEYVKKLDPVAGLPTAEECLSQITELTGARKITFDPGSASIAADAQGLLDDIADILKLCANLRIQIAGYTDSQGREEMNQKLSQDRAQAVLDALRVRRIPVGSFEAIGFGEANPIADNDSEEGREANRRIEFTLIMPETSEEAPTALEQAEQDAENTQTEEASE